MSSEYIVRDITSTSDTADREGRVVSGYVGHTELLIQDVNYGKGQLLQSEQPKVVGTGGDLFHHQPGCRIECIGDDLQPMNSASR